MDLPVSGGNQKNLAKSGVSSAYLWGGTAVVEFNSSRVTGWVTSQGRTKDEKSESQSKTYMEKVEFEITHIANITILVEIQTPPCEEKYINSSFQTCKGGGGHIG